LDLEQEFFLSDRPAVRGILGVLSGRILSGEKLGFQWGRAH
jgi:hypothetical protein